jgi:putative endonuclease
MSIFFVASLHLSRFTQDSRKTFDNVLRNTTQENPLTPGGMPWLLETYLAFSERSQGIAFEKYLKTASGIAFARKRLRQVKA